MSKDNQKKLDQQQSKLNLQNKMLLSKSKSDGIKVKNLEEKLANQIFKNKKQAKSFLKTKKQLRIKIQRLQKALNTKGIKKGVKSQQDLTEYKDQIEEQKIIIEKMQKEINNQKNQNKEQTIKFNEFKIEQEQEKQNLCTMLEVQKEIIERLIEEDPSRNTDSNNRSTNYVHVENKEQLDLRNMAQIVTSKQNKNQQKHPSDKPNQSNNNQLFNLQNPNKDIEPCQLLDDNSNNSSNQDSEMDSKDIKGKDIMQNKRIINHHQKQYSNLSVYNTRKGMIRRNNFIDTEMITKSAKKLPNKNTNASMCFKKKNKHWQRKKRAYSLNGEQKAQKTSSSEKGQQPKQNEEESNNIQTQTQHCNKPISQDPPPEDELTLLKNQILNLENELMQDITSIKQPNNINYEVPSIATAQIQKQPSLRNININDVSKSQSGLSQSSIKPVSQGCRIKNMGVVQQKQRMWKCLSQKSTRTVIRNQSNKSYTRNKWNQQKQNILKKKIFKNTKKLKQKVKGQSLNNGIEIVR